MQELNFELQSDIHGGGWQFWAAVGTAIAIYDASSDFIAGFRRGWNAYGG